MWWEGCSDVLQPCLCQKYKVAGDALFRFVMATFAQKNEFTPNRATQAAEQSGCSRPSHRRLARAGGGIWMSSLGTQRLEMQSLQHHAVASMSPTPAHRESNVFVALALTGFPSPSARFSSLLCVMMKPMAVAFSIVRRGTLAECSSQVISGCLGCCTEDA